MNLDSTPPTLEPEPESEVIHLPPSRWPVTFGIVAIVFGVAALLLSLVKITQFLMFGSGMMSKVISEGTSGTGDGEADEKVSEMVETMFSAMEEMAPKAIAAESVLIVLAIILIIGGILLQMRRRIAIRMLLVWAGAKIFVGSFAAFLALQMSMKMQQSMFADIFSGSPAGGTSPMAYIGIIYQVIFFVKILWIAALPVVFLVWLNREAIKHDLEGQTWQ